MANISDIIEAFLLEILGDDIKVNISRNELASYFSCAPSQINYVLSTRFTPERGFTTESRRGGGGFISVIKLEQSLDEIYNEFLLAPASEGLSYTKAAQLIERMQMDELISHGEGEIIKIAISDKALLAPAIVKEGLRAGILKSIFIHLIKRDENVEEEVL